MHVSALEGVGGSRLDGGVASAKEWGVVLGISRLRMPAETLKYSYVNSLMK